MSFNEYKSAVAKELVKYGYTQSEIDKFLNSAKIDKVIRTNHERYSEQKFAGCEPSAMASCLDMMYE